MNYDVHIFFTASGAWYSRFLRWVEGGEVSHVGFEYDHLETRWVLEAEKRGILTTPKANARPGVTHRFKCTYNAEKGLVAISKHVGKRYDYEGAFLMGSWLLIKKLFSWCWRKMRRPLYRTEWQKCSELFSDFVDADDLDLIEMRGRDPEWLTPQDVLLICRNNGGYFEEIKP